MQKATQTLAQDDVAEHGTGFDRGELLGVSNDDQARVGTRRLEQPGHHGERNHRWFIDNDDVVAQRVRPVVPEPGPVTSAPPEEPVKRRSTELEQARRDARLEAEMGQPGRRRPPQVVGLLCPSVPPGRCVVAGCPERRPVGRAAPAGQRHGRGLPRPWSAGDHGDPAQDGGGGGQGLLRWSGSSDSGSASVTRSRGLTQKCQVDVDYLGLGPRQELGGDQAFIEPKSVQVQVGIRTGREGCHPPRAGSGPLRRAKLRVRAMAVCRCRSAGRGLRWRSLGCIYRSTHACPSTAPGRRRRSRARRPRRRRQRIVPAGAPRGRLSRAGSPLG